jgi:glyoxylase-like metal-dependent hydrolase (beta-lactamase superfamily II)
MQKNIIRLIVGPIETNCWIYPIGEKDAAVIDPGGDADIIARALKDAALSLKYILLTHGHFDHIAAVRDLHETYNSEIAIHSLDAEYLGADAYKTHIKSATAAFGSTSGAASLIDSILPPGKRELPPASLLFEEGSEIGSLTVLHLPGHTPGSVAFGDKEDGILFTGDTLFKRGYGRTDLPGGNETALIASLRRLFAMDAGIKVFPGHGDATTIGAEA